MLLLDGWKSNLEYNFIKYAKKRKIILFGLPPYTTHFLQPLDVSCFQPYKHQYSEAIDYKLRTGVSKFNKYDFLANLRDIRSQAFKETTVLSAWRKTGLYPFNPSIVLNKLKETLSEYRTLLVFSKPKSGPFIYRTPKKINRVIKEDDDLIKELKEDISL